MNHDDPIEERQENEVEALKAIFDDAVTDLRQQDVSKVLRPPELHIRLLPQESGERKEHHVAITMAVKCDHQYPYTAPVVQLLNPRGLSDVLIKEFQIELQQKAEGLKGQEMIYSLAECVQQFLYINNFPASKSFYEQMLSNRQKESDKIAAEEQRRREVIQKQREIEYRKIEEEVEKRKSYMQQEMHSTRVDTEEMADDEEHSSVDDRQRSLKNADCSRAKRTNHTFPTDVQSALASVKDVICMELKSGRRKRIQIIKSFGFGTSGCFIHYAIDMDHDYNLLVVAEWNFRWRKPARKKPSVQQLELLREESAKYLRQLDAIDAELQSLSKLKHSGLVHYLGWRYGFHKDHVYAHVLKDYVHGTPLSAFLKEHATFSVDQTRLLAKQLLETLAYLHGNDVVHRHIKASSVFLDSSGKFLLADYAIEKKLAEIYQYSRNEVGEIITSSRSGKKADMVSFGLLLSSVLIGNEITDEICDPPQIDPPEARDFLTRCCCRLDKERWSVEQLLRHPFVSEKSFLPEKFITARATESEKGFYNHLRDDIPNDDASDLASQLATRSLALPSESRIHREFEILQFCGRGGYGDVLKVRNVLDGRTYAIKRIPLNETKEKLNKRILREVQLLSRLNHENVVRYYNSWIESASSTLDSQDTSFLTTDTESKAKAALKQPEGFVNSVGFFPDDIENNAPPAVDGSVEWSIDGTNGQREASSGEASPIGEQDFFGDSYPVKMHISTESSEEVIFGPDGIARDTATGSPSNSADLKRSIAALSGIVKSPSPTVVLFIQMEYCEKSTLRTCIDEGLYKDQERAWRLLREIVEGLGHIHQQGIIHRDLKPANIFIDSEDHVRIGDFGLATHTLMSRSTFAENLSDLQTSAMDLGTDEVSRTGRVGTALYVGPELIENTAKATYSQKVDMYSLGISFFEMCYRPLPTGMERNKVLTSIRKYPVQFPDDFDILALDRQATVIQWLCQHDPRKRPHATELLQSDLLPPPKIEEAEVNEIIRHTVQNPQSKVYKHLMSSLFSQPMNAVTDLTYDLDVQKGIGSTKFIIAFEYVERKVVDLFHLHGAIRLQTPLLMPKPEVYVGKEAVVTFMDSTGDIVMIPHDLRVPFARYVARSGISSMKRFCIDRVFRGRTISAAHPRELYECTFDVVTTFPESLLGEAECVSVISDIINEFPVLSHRGFHLRVNHTDFLRAAFSNAGIPEEKLENALNWLWDVRHESISKSHAKQRLFDLHEISEHGYQFLEKFVETEGKFESISGPIRNIVKHRGLAGALAKKALQECENFLSLLDKLGCSFPVEICLGLTDRYIRSGVIFHVVQPATHRGKAARPEIFAVGGRYSSLVQDFFKKRTPRDLDFRPVAVGISMAFEKLVNAVMSSEEVEQQSAVDVLICAVGSASMFKEQISLLRDLRGHGIKADLLMDSNPVLEDTQIFCRRMGIHLVILKDSSCTVRFVEKDKISERKLSLHELAEWISQKTAAQKSDLADTTASTGRSFQGAALFTENMPSSAPTMPTVKVGFVTSEKLLSRDRKRHTTHILVRLEPILSTFASQVVVEIFALDLPGSALKWLPVHISLSPSGTVQFEEWSQLCDKFPRHRKYFKQLHDDLQDQSFDPKTRLIVFSFLDDTYRFIT